MAMNKSVYSYLKILPGTIAIAFVILWFINLQVKGYYNRKDFYNDKVSTLIIKSNDYYGRSKEFHLRNGMLLYALYSDYNKLIIGDSVWKDSKTYFYDVYRVGVNGKYYYVATNNVVLWTDTL